jgi:hypothetical protein
MVDDAESASYIRLDKLFGTKQYRYCDILENMKIQNWDFGPNAHAR